MKTKIKHVVKFTLFLYMALIAFPCPVYADLPISAFKIHALYDHHKKIKRFANHDISKSSVKEFDGEDQMEIVVLNSKHQALRYNLDLNYRLLSYEYGRAFELFEYDEEGMLSRVIYYDKDGRLFGEIDSNDISVIEFEITDFKNLKYKLRMINQADEITELPEKVMPVTVRKYDKYGKLLFEKPMSSVDYWLWKNMRVRELKPTTYLVETPLYDPKVIVHDRNFKNK
ncbi:MAG TPA: hypothetical protein PKK26_17540 [Candidatus Wallbacteria bacterium]|nr:hypothetical protein [Candidatus Wallbacteria bacterium]